MKNLILTLILYAVLLGAAASRVHAGASQTAFQFLSLDVGPRQVGMGGAGVGLGGDVYSMAQNPAWLARFNSREIGASNALWLQDMNYSDILYAHPTPYGTFAGRFQNLSYGKIASYDATGAGQGSISAGDQLLGASYGFNFPAQRLALGGSIKVAQESIAGVTARGEMLDLGAAWFPWREGPCERLSFGLAIKNIGPSIKFDAVSEPLPREINFGGAMRFLNDRLSFALDVHAPSDRSPYPNFGGEYWVHPQFAVRAGMSLAADAGPGMQAGFGVKFGQVLVNYAFAPMGDLGMTHHIGMTLRFGKVGQKAFDEGMRLMRERQPAQAILKFEEALRLDPEHPEAAEWLLRAHNQILEEIHKED